MCKWECKDFTVEGFTLHLPYSKHKYIFLHVYIYTTRTRMRICMYVLLYVCVNLYTYIFIWSAHFRVHYYVWERTGSCLFDPTSCLPTVAGQQPAGHFTASLPRCSCMTGISCRLDEGFGCV